MKNRVVHGFALELRVTIKRLQLISLVSGFSEILAAIVIWNNLAKYETAVEL